MPALTIRAVEQAAPGSSRREIPDTVCPGLYLVVQPSGAKSWCVRYRFNGRPAKFTLGSFPKIVLTESNDERKARLARDPKSDPTDARGLARVALAAVASGRDPAHERTEGRRLEASGVASADLFATVWDAFESQHVSTLRKNTRNERKRHGELFKKRWGKRRLSEITPADVDALKLDMSKTPSAAGKALVVLGGFYAWAMKPPRRLIAVSPCTGIERPKKNKNEDLRALTDDEVRWLWRAAQQADYPFGPMIKLILLTGARRNEVAEMVEAELNRSARTWTLPAARAKNGKTHDVHLSAAAMAVLNGMPPVAGEAGYLFTTSGKTPVSGYSKAKQRLDKTMLEFAREENDNAMIAPWTLHDLRRTFATGCARIGISLQVVERCLNHVSGSLGGLVAIYNKHQYTEEQKSAFEAWGKYVTSLATRVSASNVVSIRT